jgi:uncharacterized protein (UPF0264 family)
MQLLVSVANAVEASAAVNGGADLIDAKDPLTGALGAVSLDTLRQIHRAVAGRRVVSAALGDAADEETIERAAFDSGSVGIGFVKVGFAGRTDVSCVARLVAAAVRGVHATGQDCGVVAVGYADTGGVTSVEPTALVEVAARAGAVGVLLDTADKRGPGLSRLVSPAALESWVAMAHDAGLTVALAGKLTPGDLPFICSTGADIVGVRSAACKRGRATSIAEKKVRLLRAALGAGFGIRHPGSGLRRRAQSGTG